MSIGSAFEELASEFKPRTMLLLLFAAAWTIGVFSGQFANAWWINTRGYEYKLSEAKLHSETAEDIRTLKEDVRSLKAGQVTANQNAITLSKIEGQLDILLDWRIEERRRGRQR